MGGIVWCAMHSAQVELGSEMEVEGAGRRGSTFIQPTTCRRHPFSSHPLFFSFLPTPPQYYVLRQKGTEPPGSGPLNKNYADGEYKCAGCGALLFTSDMKFDSGCGWPAFW